MPGGACVPVDSGARSAGAMACGGLDHNPSHPVERWSLVRPADPTALHPGWILVPAKKIRRVRRANLEPLRSLKVTRCARRTLRRLRSFGPNDDQSLSPVGSAVRTSDLADGALAGTMIKAPPDGARFGCSQEGCGSQLDRSGWRD